MGVDLTGVINFYSHTVEGSPPWADATPKSGWVNPNYVRIPTRVSIYDLRGKENDFHLDKNGFEVHKYQGNIHNVFDDQSEEQQSYYQDIINILKNRLGASRVVVFNHVIRFRGPPRPADQCDRTHNNPIYYPHNDNNPSSARAKVNEVLGEEEGQQVMKNRFQIINIWKPLGSNPIVNNPLTICDYQSIDLKNDIHLSDVRGTEKSTSSFAFFKNIHISKNIQDAQKWYYLSNMKSDEMFVFKIFDSDQNVAQFGAHTAFINENAPSPDTEQCSIEVRCFAFYDQ